MLVFTLVKNFLVVIKELSAYGVPRDVFDSFPAGELVTVQRGQDCGEVIGNVAGVVWDVEEVPGAWGDKVEGPACGWGDDGQSASLGFLNGLAEGFEFSGVDEHVEACIGLREFFSTQLPGEYRVGELLSELLALWAISDNHDLSGVCVLGVL